MSGENMYVARIEYVTPQLAGLYKDLFTYRIFRKGDFVVVINKHNLKESLDQLRQLQKSKLLEKADISEIIKEIETSDLSIEKNLELYRQIKKILEKEKFAALDFLFPRDANLEVDLHKTLVRPVYFVLTKDGGWSINKIVQIVPINVKYGMYFAYIGTTKSPVVYETIEKNSVVNVIFSASNEGKTKFMANLGRARKLGFGTVKISVEKLNTST